MSDRNGDQVEVVGSTGNPPPPPRLAPSSLVLLVVGLVGGVALGVLLSSSGSEPPATTAPTLTAAVETTSTTTTESSASSDELLDRIEDLESLLEEAEKREFELGLEVAPGMYAPVLGCDARQKVSGQRSDGFLVGPLGFWFPSDESGEFHEVSILLEPAESVTLVVPKEERDSVSLFWDPSTWRGDRSITSGDPAVTLAACNASFPTVFAGGMVSEQDYCAPLDIYLGDDPEPERVILPIGQAQCSAGTIALVFPELGPVPDVTGMSVRDARLAIRKAAFIPSVNPGDSLVPDGRVWGQEPSPGESPGEGSIIGLRTCRPADDVAATYQGRLEGTGVTLSEAWMAPLHDDYLESWYFVSALVSGGSHDGQVATWAIPGFTPGVTVDSTNTPNLSFPANEVSQSFDFGDRRFTPEDYGVSDWLDLDGAIASQRCVRLGG